MPSPAESGGVPVVCSTDAGVAGGGVGSGGGGVGSRCRGGADDVVTPTMVTSSSAAPSLVSEMSSLAVLSGAGTEPTNWSYFTSPTPSAAADASDT